LLFRSRSWDWSRSITYFRLTTVFRANSGPAGSVTL
jgi:hypothetical protein